jgi:nitrite reductase/ring-hydroxylating ferredoxin subunit
MQSIDTHNTDLQQVARGERTIDAGRVEDLPDGSCKTIELPAGRELALFNVNGEFYAIENFCPHKGAPLSQGILCSHVIECDLHGWQFDVRTGECLTVPERIETYAVAVEDHLIKIVL